MFRITQAEIDEMRASQYDRSVLADAEPWLAFTKRADRLIAEIETAFAGVRLGDGIGLLEASGLDDYAPGSDLSDLRELDEKTDWRRIDDNALSRANAANKGESSPPCFVPSVHGWNSVSNNTPARRYLPIR